MVVSCNPLDMASLFKLYMFIFSCFAGIMPIPDLILQFERSCRDVSESIRCVMHYKVYFSFILPSRWILVHEILWICL